MKTILVLTNFSENAKHAAKTAMALAQNLHSDILLYNSIVMMPALPYDGGPVVMEGMPWWTDDNKDQMNRLSEYLETGYDKTVEGQFVPKIRCELGDDTLGKDVEKKTKNKNIELVVMGGRSGDTVEHILMGSDTNAVIKHANCPVLVVPPQADIQNIQKVVFASDFDSADIKAINYLDNLRQTLHFELEVVHVSPDNEDDKKNFGQEVIFTSMINSLRDANTTYKTIRGKDVVNRLSRLCHETNADVLAMVHHKNSFLSRILKASTTKYALHNQKTPLLVIPSTMA